MTDVFGASIEALLNRLDGVIEEVVHKEFEEYFIARGKDAPIDVEFLADRLSGVIEEIVQKELEGRIPAGVKRVMLDGVVKENVRKALKGFTAELERERRVLQADFDVWKRAVTNGLAEFGKPNFGKSN